MKTDLHTHTIASGHAFGSIMENAKLAKEKGIELMAVTDHGPSGHGCPVDTYFRCWNRVPKMIDGVRILFGVEANIVDDEGTLDLPDNILKKLDVVIVGLHPGCGYLNQGIEKNTEVLVKAMNNPYVKMVSHPYWNKFDVDIEKITQTAIDKNIILELNASFFYRDGMLDEPTLNKVKLMVSILKEHGQKILINSDAHSPYEIGRFEEVIAGFEELGITHEDILNYDVPSILNFFNILD